MRNFNLLLLGVLSVLFSSATHAMLPNDEVKQVEAVLMTILHDNSNFSRQHNHQYFEKFSKQQHPRATVVTCADSRVHDQALEQSPDNDLFIVRNIGNQIYTAEGSVEYGVHHLHTPLLLIVGHSSCGAIKAASAHDTHVTPAIKHELATISALEISNLDDEAQVIAGVKHNVNHQVAYALKKFEQDVKTHKLTVIGAVYDFTNILHHGEGRLTITNVNGDHEPQHVKLQLELMRQDLMWRKNHSF